jgi:hypothetical protein
MENTMMKMIGGCLSNDENDDDYEDYNSNNNNNNLYVANLMFYVVH